MNSMEHTEHEEADEESLGVDDATGGTVFVKEGRFGPYVQLVLDDGSRPKNASLLPSMNPSDVTLETALKLLALPRELGEHPDAKQPVTAHNGRYGPYIKCGSETRSLPSDISPIEVELGQALLLLAQPKKGGKGGSRPPIKDFGKPSPVTGNTLQILDGKYGPYITDGTTNVSVPKAREPQELEFDEALTMLAERAAKRPSKKKRAAKKKETDAPIPTAERNIADSDEAPF